MTDDRQRDNSGVLFRNDRKSADRDPDYRGNATINGVAYWMSAWIKEGRNGKFMSFAFTPKDALRTTAKSAARQTGGAPFSDEIPFLPERRG